MLVRRARALRHPIGGLALVRPFVLSRAVTYTRTGLGTGVTAAGLVYEVAADVPRFDAAGRLIWEGQRTSQARNFALSGAVAGTPGTAPTNVSITDGGSISRRIVGYATENGYTCLDVEFTCTAVAAGIGFLVLDSSPTASAGDLVTGGCFLKIVSGTPPTFFRWLVQTGAANALSGTFALPATLTNMAQTVTIPTGGTIARFNLENRQAGYTGVFVVRMAGLQVEVGAFASTGIPTTGAAAITRGADTGIFNLFGSAGTIAFSAVPGQAAPAGVDQTLYTVNDGTDANRLSVVNLAGGNSIVLRRVVAGAVTDSAAIGTQTPGTLLRGVLTWSGTDAAAKIQGGTWRTQSSTSGGFIRGRLGNIIAGSSPLFGTMGWGDLLPRSVSEAEADAIMARIPA
jgi:hypothetical protein